MLQLYTAPAAEPLTVAEAKEWLRITHTVDDATLMPALIAAARKKVENYTGLKLISQVWDKFYDSIPWQKNDPWWDGEREGSAQHLFHKVDSISLETGPVSAVTAFYYTTTAGTETTFSSASYYLDSASPIGRIILKPDALWPTDIRDGNGVKVRFTAGYGSASTSIPQDLLMAVRLILSHLYENRGDTDGSMPDSAVSFMSQYTQRRLA